MKIKRLEIHGFKSFMDKTVFHFGGGMTAVVGPNGCGKSNIVDAMLWCMGEQSPKHLRGKDMQDVIFAGSENRPPMGMAEVSLIFAVEDRPTSLGPDVQLPPDPAPAERATAPEAAEPEAPEAAAPARPSLAAAPIQHLTSFSEVQVTRRLFRSGESEYLMNKTPCRLRDIQELFMDAGIGKGGYSIIEQGKVGMIVSAKPEDRRIFIEEAAGIAKFKSRKKQALAKIEQTEQNLLRVNDVVTELAKQMASLDRQAKKAERYRKLRDEIRDIDLKVAASDHQKRILEYEAEQASLAMLREKEIGASAEIANAEGEVEVVRGSLVEEERELSTAQERLFGVNNQIKLDEQNLEYAVRELDKLKATAEAAKSDIERLRGDLARIGEESARATSERDTLEGDVAAKTAALAEQASSLEASKSRQKELLHRVDELKGTVVEAMQAIASCRSQIVNLEKRAVELRGRLERGESERQEVGDRVNESRRAQKEAASALAGLKQMKLGLEQQRAEHAALLERLKADVVTMEAEAKSLSEELSAKKSRLVSLQELQSSYEGYQKGVRAVMARAGIAAPAPISEEALEEDKLPDGPPTDGGATMSIAAHGASALMAAPAAPPAEPAEKRIFGLVADHLDTPQRFESALEAVLGDRLQAVIVKSHEEGLDSVSFLKEKAAGRGTFIPLDLAAAEEGSWPDLAQPGVLGRLLDQVHVRPEFGNVARYLLGDVIVVESLPRAVELARANRAHRKSWVTLEGEVVDAAGAITGGGRDGLATGLLQRKREIKELVRTVASLEQAHAQKSLAREQLAKRLGQVEDAIKALQKNEHEEAIRILHHEKDLAALGERLERDRQRQEVLEFEAGQLRSSLEEVGQDRAADEQRIGTEQGRKDSADAELATLTEQARGISAEIEAAASAETHLKVTLAELRSRRDSLGAEIDRLAKGRVEVEGRIQRLGEQIETAAMETVRITADGERLRASIDELVKSAEEMRLTLLERREKFDGASLALREREAAIKSLRGRLQELKDAISTSQLRENELAMNLKHAAAQILERYNEDLEAKWREWLDPTFDFEMARAQVAELKERMLKMGEVNMAAIEELKEVATRHDFLAQQKSDLEHTLAQLKDTIAKINRTSRERFLETFEKVNAKFQEVFPKLFRGGKAHLTLTGEDGDVLEAGVDIVAMPPGKKLQNINLLSGGEKALTAVSLIVAIFLIRPTPFCLLDEVDAPLDEANVGRYNEIVREMSNNTQFIVITHNKRTMAVCDALYGITMEEPGVSKMVSVKFNGQEMQTTLAET